MAKTTTWHTKGEQARTSREAMASTSAEAESVEIALITPMRATEAHTKRALPSMKYVNARLPSPSPAARRYSWKLLSGESKEPAAGAGPEEEDRALIDWLVTDERADANTPVAGPEGVERSARKQTHYTCKWFSKASTLWRRERQDASDKEEWRHKRPREQTSEMRGRGSALVFSKAVKMVNEHYFYIKIRKSLTEGGGGGTKDGRKHWA